MPYSSDSGKSYIKDIYNSITEKTSILDIGVGSGTYSKLFRQPGSRWTGVEIWQPYIDKFNLKELYDEIICEDIRTWRTDKTFDICFIGDILEHITAEEAVKVLAYLKEICKNVIVSIPIGYYPQDEYEGNPHEAHVTDNWTNESYLETFGSPTKSFIDNEIGVYVYQSEPSKLKICIYAISKNEEKFVQRFYRSAKDADLIVLADTGSTDNTVALARECGMAVYEIAVTPWRFDTPRNVAMSMVPKDYDVLISIDLDEELQPGWREEIERLWVKGVTNHMRYKYDWSGGVVFFYEKIHGRTGFQWVNMCHEVLSCDPRVTESWVQTDMLLVVHKPDPTKSRGQYLDLLDADTKENPYNERNAFYYARELSFHGHWEKAIAECERYLAMPKARWDTERCYARRVQGKCYDALGQHDKALWAWRQACVEAPKEREPWVGLADSCHDKRMWNECFFAATQAISIEKREALYTTDPTAWGYRPYDLAALSAWHLGIKEKAIEYGQKAIELEPDSDRLKDNLKWYMGTHD